MACWRISTKDVGYEQDGFHWAKCDCRNPSASLSADIVQGVDAMQPSRLHVN
ncbi:MAG: hypothetical protein ACREDL_08650 [Bradyrhizobium sp.]